MRILLAEDERPLSRALVKILEKNNYAVDAVYNGKEALEYLASEIYDGAIFDIMMPQMDGITALRTLRAGGNPIPVLLLTAKAEVEDKVLGLDSGANYYLTKPFDSKELLAALRAITRASTAADTKLTFGNVALDTATFELSGPGGSFKLANKEFQLCQLLMANPRNVISGEKLMEKIWGFDSDSEINVVWAYISYLKKKLTALKADIQIKTYRNAGYALEKTDD